MRCRDHPREYGENKWVADNVVHLVGPSPRIRGELARGEKALCHVRTIPANTGRIVPRGLFLRGLRDHPREYGENVLSFAQWGDHEGPSPRIRGESRPHPVGGAQDGTIPANTGRITQVHIRTGRTWDHPREYGENTTRQTHSGCCLGPSPRIRGEYRQPHLRLCPPRTIPANTGRIESTAPGCTGTGDHPREYGENVTGWVVHSLRDGPSPRIRGESYAVTRSSICGGTIPANTGRMHGVERWIPLHRDHPREYGENEAVGVRAAQVEGPSPRIRGESCGTSH